MVVKAALNIEKIEGSTGAVLFCWDNNFRAIFWRMIVRAKMTNQVSLAELTDYFIQVTISYRLMSKQ